MSAIRLLVLGAVRGHGRAHGYQVRNDLEYWGAHEWSNAKPGSIYHALKQMAKQGLLHAHETAPSTAGGPPRTEYEITERGTEEYFTLLRQALVTHDRGIDLLSTALGFMVDLDRAEVLDLLRERLRRLAEWRASVAGHYLPRGRPGAQGPQRGDMENMGPPAPRGGARGGGCGGPDRAGGAPGGGGGGGGGGGRGGGGGGRGL
ncbi:PadR family transcriptional regulator, partial [Streptomyces sp. NPDC127190]|uniref:PadR family transcriptional regulator n=1 Tax=Streptomyces sp. NPDC127190 TaxID=3345387 RepID=UPI003636F409